jgi:hypothetical protein
MTWKMEGEPRNVLVFSMIPEEHAAAKQVF